MDTNETLKPNDYASIVAAMEAQRAALDEAIPTMRALASLSGALIPAGTNLGINRSPTLTLIAPGEVPPGSFHKMSIPEAAVLYLRMVKQKQKAAEIAAALRRGGIETTSKKFNNQIHAALDRSSKTKNSEIIKLHGAYWALREWFPASVRASMASGAASTKKTRRANKSKKNRAAPAEVAKPKQEPKSNNNVTVHAEAAASKEPEAGTKEGRILNAMRQNSAKEWTANEVAAAAAIPRVQTVHFLLGKLAFRKIVQKTDAGAFRIQ